MLNSAVSLPPVGELTAQRSDIDSAVAALSGVPSPPMAHPTGQLNMAPSPHQTDTPMVARRPTSPFALAPGSEDKGELLLYLWPVNKLFSMSPYMQQHVNHAPTGLESVCTTSHQHYEHMRKRLSLPYY